MHPARPQCLQCARFLTAAAPGLLWALIGWLVSSGARAEELGLLAGRAAESGDSFSTYAWQLEYRQKLNWDWLAASFSYLNEGHQTDHHRDGGAVQLWLVSPQWRERWSLAFGAGPYFYADTQFWPAPPWFRDYHGLGELYTLSLTYSMGERWYARLNLNDVHTQGDIDTHSVLIGIGYRLDELLRRSATRPQAQEEGGVNEAGVFAGETVINSDLSGRSVTFGAEYRRRIAWYVSGSFSWLSEDDGLDSRHNGLLGELWLSRHVFDPRFALGVGAGPYASLQEHRTDDGREASTLSGIVSMTASWQLTHSLVARATWHRALTNDDQDRDIIIAGLAWQWGE